MSPYESGAVIDMFSQFRDEIEMREQAEKAMPPDTLTATAPERIWLQIDPAGADIDRAEPFPADASGVTWCRDDVGGVQVEYVRADLAGPAPIGADALREALYQALDFIEFCWRDVAMSQYAEERRDETERILRAALASAAQPEIEPHPPHRDCGCAECAPSFEPDAAAPRAAPARWYMVNAVGMATLCADRQDAEQAAADAQAAWPHAGPHRAVQMLEVAAAHTLRASRGQAPAPAAVAGPVAWLHDDPQRYDVIHAEVKDLLVKSRDAAGHLHRPLDKSAHYTIPLYAAPAPAAQGDAMTDSYVQQVPDKCDRIVWRGNYYHLPIAAACAAKEADPVLPPTRRPDQPKAR